MTTVDDDSKHAHGEMFQDKFITFKDALNPKSDYDQLCRLLKGSLDDKENMCLSDLKGYLIKKEDAWVLDQKLLDFIGGLLEHR